ncbi:hypothetical protein GF369_01725 [Candidatus Peregrinibacteria bacterium]|nr:hypothetical protein [Candidatus Peregrinibacteria bacterium]
MAEENPILSIGPDGVKINTTEGSSLKTNTTNTIMEGVEQYSSGGEISHKATDTLVQKDNEMSVSGSGKITNQGSVLYQEGNIMKATDNGEISNIVGNGTIVLSVVLILSILADVATLLTTGKHFWQLFNA